MSLSDITRKNILFDAGVSTIAQQAQQIEGAAHLFDVTTRRRYSTELDKFNLRASAEALRTAADCLDKIAERLEQ